jgi:hypothetical protein
MAFFRFNIYGPWSDTIEIPGKNHASRISPAISIGIPHFERTEGRTETKSNVVYVCACLKTKSCSCMTETKMEGPCACGTEGGPPLKAVPKDSAWAKENREALAK